MNDTHLTSFVAVADSGSISKAAKRLYITPQALSQQIDLLEREYNAKLFTRS
ncbi:MAG: LysR family transcriptional regulator, partial [Eggerthellaceae bacterium]|nr:LysR family transcriptional regulator [Eggerthellaceae bacterium]